MVSSGTGFVPASVSSTFTLASTGRPSHDLEENAVRRSSSLRTIVDSTLFKYCIALILLILRITLMIADTPRILIAFF